jgi:SAM-dependent methyltransferase
MATSSANPRYLLRRDEAETQRLILQSRFFDPYTRRLLLEAGLEPGMTVLDIGSGAGDVALLAADIVGPTGTVVGVDSDPNILETARARAGAAGLYHLSFQAGDCHEYETETAFDAVVGRLVLLHVSDPAATVRSVAEHVRPGGIVAFQEVNTTHESIRSIPSQPIWHDLSDWAQIAIDQAGRDRHMGFALRQVFLDAGLPEPRMHLDSEIGGGLDWDGYAFYSALIHSMSPGILESGRVTPEELGLDTLADRLRIATIQTHVVVKTPDVVSAWVRKR